MEKLFFAVPAASADLHRKTDGSYVNRPFFRFKQDVRKSIFSPKNILPRSVFCFFSSREEIVPPSFLFRRKEVKESRLWKSFLRCCCCFPPTRNTKRMVHIRTVRFSVSSRMCGKASFLRKTSSPAVSFVSFLQEKKSYPFLFFLERKGSKRKSTAGELLLCSPAVFHNVQHKTDGSHTNRPFFRFKQDVRKSIFSQINHLSRSVFCFFSSRKEIVPPSRKENVPLQPQ